MTVDRRLPDYIKRRAEEVADALRSGRPYQAFKGKKLEHDRSLVSIPLGMRYRMVARLEEECVEPLVVMSHETYNKWLRKR